MQLGLWYEENVTGSITSAALVKFFWHECWRAICLQYITFLPADGTSEPYTVIHVEMHDEIFHFEIFKNFMKILKYFKTLFEIFYETFNIFNIKWLKTFKNMIKVYQVRRRYIMLFMHNNKYLALTGLLTLLQWTIHNTSCMLNGWV